ncbi:MAG: YceH family protein [Burkholderiales bacterium]
MNLDLTLHETRVIGCLIEKEITTPEQYPLSLNALTNACNQKSNRDPVLDLDEATVQQLVDQLTKKRLVSEQSGYGNRVPKFQHLFCNTTFGTLKFSPEELGIICELFLRGPQTPGELRSRASRLCRFGDVSEVETVLMGLASREDGPYVIRLAREPGKRESRYAHLFSGELAGAGEMENREGIAEQAQGANAEGGRMDLLERRVTELENAVTELKQRLKSPAGD